MKDIDSSKIEARAIKVAAVPASLSDTEGGVAPDVRGRIKAAMINFRLSVRKLNAER